LGYGLLKSNNFVPEEVQMLKDIESLQEKLKQATSEEERKTLQREIETRRLKYNLLMDRFHRRR
jgi:ribonucleotide reductase beta subunit family protein with ferritin-like domain